MSNRIQDLIHPELESYARELMEPELNSLARVV